MPKFDIKNYPDKYVMHCKTEEEAKNFCDYMHSIGRKWFNGNSYKDTTEYNAFMDKTVYYFNESVYGSIKYAQEKGYKILEWSDFMNKKFTKADLKTGDVILRRNGWVEIVILELNMFICKDGWNDIDDIFENLTHHLGSQYDIVAVRRPRGKDDCQFSAFDTRKGDLIYDRERDESKVEEMTLAEVCKALGKEIKIVKE